MRGVGVRKNDKSQEKVGDFQDGKNLATQYEWKIRLLFIYQSKIWITNGVIQNETCIKSSCANSYYDFVVNGF